MRWKWLLAIPMVLALFYLCGPGPTSPRYVKQLPVVPSDLDSLVNYVRDREAVHRLKPDNEARIVWANDINPQKTDVAIVYLHGFGASQGEGYPVHRNIARDFGCNLYLSRLAEHGLDTVDQLVGMTADNLWNSAEEALAIGQQLGRKVILMGTSTGGTMALMLAAAYPDQVAGLVLYSPNIAIFDSKAWILNDPWGLQVARWVRHSKYFVNEDTNALYLRYWYKTYRLEALVQLEELLETSMNEKTFREVHQPTLALYYYRDAVHQDSVVRVSAIVNMFDELGTPAELKRKEAMPLAGNHVICSPIRSGDVAGVEQATSAFLHQVMGLQPR
jgi:pimeloyl-ACP methyl ester carboxylesterase